MMDRKKWIKTGGWLAMGAVAFFLGGRLPAHMIYTTTHSLDHRLFFMEKVSDPSKIQKGAYVMLTHYTTLIEHCTPCRITKKISCVEGDRLEEKHSQFFCNGEPVAYAKQVSLKGKPIDHFKFNGIVPKGKIFITGQNANSFDSRYFGFKDKNDVEAICIPVL